MHKCSAFLLFILIFTHNVLSIKCFDVKFREFNNLRIEEDDEKLESIINKRDMTQFFDKASFSFNGFNKIESVPVMFPLDICLLNVQGVRYATSLHKNKNAENSFAVFKLNHASYELLADIALPNAIAMDCKSIGAFGYVAIALNITAPIENAREGSPIYEISDGRVRAVQYFAAPNMRSVYLRVTGNDLFLLQAFHNTKATPNLNCPYFKWSGTTFNKLGLIPCSNARNLQPFSINYENYVAVANYADQYGRTNVNSEIYKFNRATQKFQLLQRIKTNGAVDVKHFKVPQNSARNQHFLIFGNSMAKRAGDKPGEHLEADSVFYIYDKGQFVPYQSISLYAVEKFLPIENQDAEKFLLLVACANQDLKIYNLNDWKFELSTVQYTEGALGKGIAKMRVHDEQENSYLVIANELMADNETNIFQAIFKQEEHVNVLREEIIKWTKASMERLAAIDVAKLQNDVERKLSEFQQKPVDLVELTNANISTVITKSLNYAPLHFNADYWLALRYAKKALDVLQVLYPSERLQRRQLREQLDFTTTHNVAYEFKEMHLTTLIVRDALKANKLNGISTTQPEFKSIKAQKLIVNGSSKESRVAPDSLHAAHLRLNGTLNGHAWSDFVNNTLKRHGVQFIKSAAHVRKLQSDVVDIATNTVSGHNLDKLVSIGGGGGDGDGSYVINQDVQFAFPIKVKNLLINERLNNIHVHKQRFDVLLRRANETQVIEGAKNFENIRILEPVTLSGKMLGAHLQEMLPNKAIHEPLVLQGNYTIRGDVTIRKMLQANDLLELQKQRSVGELLHNGITLTAGDVNDLNIKFALPITANDSTVSFINGKDMQQLVRTNVDQVQVIEGEKRFGQSVTIDRGFSEVKHLNGIDTERLAGQLLLKDTNQTITVPMHFGRVVAKNLGSENITLNTKPLDAYLTHSADQVLAGNLKVANVSTQTLRVSSLNTNGNVLGVPLKEIYQRRSKIAPIEATLLAGEKFNGSIYARNLIIRSSINGVAVESLERQLSQLDGNIKYVGDFHFNYAMNISSLTFAGSLNGIAASDFGKCWLQKLGNQSFTAPQTLASVESVAGLQLRGKLNSHQLDEFYRQTYWITRDEHMQAVHFANPIQMQGVLATPKLNDLSVPADMLLKQAEVPQALRGHVHVQGNVSVKGDILNVTHINAHNLEMLKRFLHPNGYNTLNVEHATFVTAPTYQTLNGHNLKRCLDEAWLANENVVLQQHVEITDANFTGLLQFEGPINNYNLKYVQENYVSLTQPQEINTELIFDDSVYFKAELLVDDVHLHADIVDMQSNAQFNFDKFAVSTLKTFGPQTISAPWHMDRALIYDHLRNVQINGLNLRSDVVRMDMPLAAITATKQLKRANIQKLYATPMSTINTVPIADWIKESVYVYDNVTIYGNTEIDALNLFNGLKIRCSLNNKKFDGATLMLRNEDQTITGNLHIQNSFPAEQRFLTNNIENLNVGYVNGWPLNEFLTNAAVINSTQLVSSHLVFKQPITVREYQDNVVSESSKVELKHTKRGIGAQLNVTLNELVERVDYLRNHIKDSLTLWNHFALTRSLSVTATKMIVFNKLYNNTMQEFVGLIDMESNKIEIYYWSRHSRELALHEAHDFSYFLQNEIAIVKQQQRLGKETRRLVAEFSIAHETQNCTGVYGEDQSNVEIFCAVATDNGTVGDLKKYADIPRSHVKQILTLNDPCIALLLANELEVWNMDTLQVTQRIKLLGIMRASIRIKDEAMFLAVASEDPMSDTDVKLNIYHSLNRSTFELIQHFPVSRPMDLDFSLITDDVLLYILTAVPPQKLLIFEYKEN